VKAKIIINLCRAERLPFPLNKEDAIIDLTNTIANSNKSQFSAFLNDNKIVSDALHNYRFFSKQLAVFSKSNFNFYINDFNVFFILKSSIKHPVNYWAKDFFLLQSLLIHQKNKIENNYTSVVLLFPNDLKFAEKDFDFWIKTIGYKIPVSFLYTENQINKPSLYLLIKTTLSNFKRINNYKIPSGKIPKENNTQCNVYLTNRLDNKHSYFNMYAELKKLFKNKHKDISLLPTLEWRKQTLFSENADIDFFYSKPNFFQQSGIILQLIFLYFKINWFKTSKKIIVEKLNIPLSFLKDELNKTLHNNIHLLILHIWLVNYFKRKKHNVNVFFEDEFYEYGRIISSAIKLANNNKIKHKAYGLQHGHFNEIHTVYTITDEEVHAGLPMPDRFICWGNYYKQLFLSNNSISENFVEAIGNPKYVNNYSLNSQLLQPEIKNILWCLTTKECLETEWNIIQQYSSLNSFNITIRLHPVGHITADELKHLVKGLNYKLSNLSRIEDEFAHNDLIICSAHSTIFLDALLFKKHCIRIVSRLWVGNKSFDNAFLHTVKNFDEFNNAINQIIHKKIDVNIQHTSSNLEFNKDKWLKFIENLQND
jgi:hypothetical protein